MTLSNVEWVRVVRFSNHAVARDWFLSPITPHS
jgi:hypothetical protein